VLVTQKRVHSTCMSSSLLLFFFSLNILSDNPLKLFPFRSSIDVYVLLYRLFLFSDILSSRATSKACIKQAIAPAPAIEEPIYRPRYRPRNPEPPKFRLRVPAVVPIQAWVYEFRHRRRAHVASPPSSDYEEDADIVMNKQRINPLSTNFIHTNACIPMPGTFLLDEKR
jgi:hypothetical protein